MRHLLAAIVLAGALGCELEPEPVVRYAYAPYEGEAFPDRLPPVQLPAGGAALVTDSLSDTISILDVGSGERVASFPVGRDPVGIDGPHHVAVDALQKRVFTALSYPPVTATGPHAAHGSSVQSGWVQRLDLTNFRIAGQVRVDPNPGDIVLSDDGKRLIVTHFDLQRALDNPGDVEKARASLALIDPAAILPSASPEPARVDVCVAPHGAALSRPDGATAWVACYGEDALAVVDLAKLEVVERVPVADGAGFEGDPDFGPYAAVLSPDQSTLVVANLVSKDLRFFDVATKTFDPARTIKTFGAPYFPAWSADGATLVVPTQVPHAIIVFDVAGGAGEIARRDFAPGECDFPHVVVPVAGDRIMVVCEGDRVEPGRVVTLDAQTLETESSAEVGVYPDALLTLGGAR